MSPSRKRRCATALPKPDNMLFALLTVISIHYVKHMSKRALVILHEGVEEMEAIAPIDILRRGGIEVVIASTTDSHQVTGRSKVTLMVDVPLIRAADQDYDCIILPGGPGIIQSVRSHDLVKRLLKQQFDAGKWVAGICAAPLVLADAGILRNKQYTAHPSAADELSDRIPNQSVIVDPPLITSPGAGTATAFALEILARLTSTPAADEVAASICLLKIQ